MHSWPIDRSDAWKRLARHGRGRSLYLILPVVVAAAFGLATPAAFAGSDQSSLSVAKKGKKVGKNGKKKRKPPAGAIPLKGLEVNSIGKARCALRKATWIPGSITKVGKKKYFLSHAQQAKNLNKQATKAKGKKRKKLQARAKFFERRAESGLDLCNRAGGPNPGPGDGAPLRFDIGGAVGLALGDSAQAAASSRSARAASDHDLREDEPSSNIDSVGDDGQVSEAASSGSADAQAILIAPNGKVYIIFENAVNLADTSSSEPPLCALAEVDPDTGVPTCIDDDLQRISNLGINPPVQFDAAGAVYYTGYNKADEWVLRRHSGGRNTDLITDQVTTQTFYVLADGSVLIAGYTDATQNRWTRRVTPAGGLQTVRNDVPQWIRPFADNNVYMGFWGTDYGVRRYFPVGHQLDPEYWISDPALTGGAETEFNAADFCQGGEAQAREGFCSTSGTWVTDTFNTTNGQSFAISAAIRGTFARYYPQLSFPDVGLKSATAGEAAGSDVFVAGVDGLDRNVLVRYDTVGDTSTVVIGPANEVEVYHLRYVPSENKVMFDGLRFADNKYVIGEVDLATNSVTFSPTGTDKWRDFQTFG